MELQRGVCNLCLENSRVLISQDAEDICELLPVILKEDFLTDSAFQKIKGSLKICSLCCFKIQVANETKDLLGKTEDETKNGNVCHFCKTDKFIVKIGNNWKQFNDRTEGVLNQDDFPVCACPRCIFYFDTIFNFKSKLSFKFPYLAVQKRRSGDTPQKQNDTPKRKSLSKSPPSSKKRKIFDNCFDYLQPLCNNDYHVDNKLKSDLKLYRKIAYVNLENAKNIVLKQTPKKRPKIKIKLVKHKKESHKCKSEELPKSDRAKEKTRRYSSVEPSKKSPEELEETPKAASISTLVPKRRVSVYLKENDKQTESSDEPVPEEAKDILSKYVSETNNSDICEAIVDVIEQKVAEEPQVEQNGVSGTEAEETENEKEEEETSPHAPEIQNGETAEAADLTILEEKPNEELTAESTEPREPTLEKNESEASEFETKSNPETESLNGSERKKKHVTFSDDVFTE
ncbi:uncharacterized protein LOC103312658 [Tribolium castaneum]|uniref:Uncharacterized protein n=1 Tax=Tribolium castaneum TaxID=7070 RepID=D1ZZH1_TRICA|nr:PREDICTED: uncharacterized protein LOC103312658 [Tribolium castaneum]EFA02369.2 hypothetical protein TcasGA2_TC008044 [Tribolium castaneum]|eukprot:XP_008192071.1 PREDICTED: uncharacterized protein LOC103312658 [Tribolium castaneum]